MAWKFTPDPRRLAQPDLADTGRAEFLKALDAADLELDEWLIGTTAEPGFLPNMLKRVDQGKPFTDRMRVQIDKLMNRYLGQVKLDGSPGGSRPKLTPVRSQTREAYVPDEAAKLLRGK